MSGLASIKVSLLFRTGAVALSVAIVSPTHAQVRGTVDVSAQGTVASSPFLDGDDGGAAVSAGIRIEPSLVFLIDEVTSASLGGSVAVDQYASEYGNVKSFRFNAGVQHRIDERTSFSANALAQSSRNLVRDFLQNTGSLRDSVLGSLDPDNSQDNGQDLPSFGPDAAAGLDPDFLAGIDSGLVEAGQRGRTNSYAVGASLSRVLSPRDNLTLGVLTTLNRSDDENAQNYSAATLTASYRRTLSNQTGLQAKTIVQHVNYEDGAGGGDGMIYTPTVGLDYQFSEQLSASVEVGASFTNLESPDGVASKDVSFAGSVSLCGRQLREQFCATASRSARPTLFGGVTNVTSAAVSYGRVLSLQDDVSISAQYSRNGASVLGPGQAFIDSQSLVAVSANYNRRISQRLYAFVSPGYARTSGGAFESGRENYQFSAGIRYRFGNTL